MSIFERKFRIPFLQLFLSSIMFTTVITCIQAKDRSTEIKTHTELGYRLPKDVQPRHYNIKIEFSETLDHLNGECEIDIEIFKATSNIRLYNPEPKKQPMYYHKIKLNMKNSADESIADEYPVEIGYSEEEYILNLYFNQQLSPGNYSLFIKYETNISKGIQKGYFIKILFPPEARSEARQNTLLATNIHSIEARHLFPCWDEPELKATFQFRFTHQQKYKIWPISVSGRSTRDDYKQNWLCTNFFIKDKISTYQLMFILTDFEFYIKTKVITYNALALFHTVIKLSIASRPRVENSMQFLYNVSNKILHSMWWWHHKLPLRRNITLLAIPAMKEDVIANRGLILYKESLVTYDKQIDSYVRQREVASIVARGIAYQLVEEIIVTLPWWSHLWFNKGLATLLHVMILDEVFGKWGFMDLFVVQVHQDCLHLDTNFIMKPLSYEVQTSSEIKSLFSFPIYVKAPVILRMVRHIMGKTFDESYKKSIMYSTYLWDMIQGRTLCSFMVVIDNRERCKYTMKDIMETWITTNNYPIVHIHRNASKLFIFQSEEKLYLDKDNDQVPRHWIPITFITGEQLDFKNTIPRDWITPENSNGISVRLTDNNGWIILNLQQTGYYRVKYDNDSLEFITNYLKFMEFKKIHVLNRAQIIDDTYYFLMRGEVTYDTFVRLMYYLARDRNYIAWYPMFQIFIDLSYFLPFAESEVIKQDMGYILRKLLSTLSYNEKSDDNDLTMRLRQEAAKWACIFGDRECQHIATDRLKEHLEDPTNRKLSLEWRKWTYCKGAIKADESVLLKLEELHINHSKGFNYISCAEKPRLAIDIFYQSALTRKDRYPTLSSYVIFIDYAVKYTNDIIGIMATYK